MNRRSQDWAQNARFAVFLIFLATCFLWGGGSRLDIPGLLLVQPAAVLCLAAMIIIPGPVRLEAIRIPLLLLCGLALAMAVQLIPLPPAIWMSLKGHAAFVEVAPLAGIEQPWRPLSLTPDLTLSSLVGLVVPAAALVGLCMLSPEQGYRLLPWLLGAVGLTILLGLGQIGGGAQSSLYRYEITNRGVAVGFFSNRNHQAVLLAMTFPMLALWMTMPARIHRHHEIRRWVAMAMAVLLIPMILVTGSRAGLALGLVGLVFAWAQLRASRRADSSARKYHVLLKIAPVMMGALVFLIAIMFSRAVAIDRLFGSSVGDDLRVQFLPTSLQIARDFFPLGSGFGSFDPIFRVYEPLELLRSAYFNHAHNDLLELAITGGAPALLLLAVFMLWAVRQALRVFRGRFASRREGFARLAVAMIVIMFASSLVDYPLRTPLLGALFALACGWLANFSFNLDAIRSDPDDTKNALRA